MSSKVIEDYTLMEKVGQGQYGNVYKAQNMKDNKLYAIKVMHADKFKQTPKLSEFTNNQIAILSKISHPNIIKFIQMLRTTNNFYLVYEYCNGGTLGEFIKLKGKLTEAESVHIFKQLRDAFAVLNDSHILHRDLKPTNILFHDGVVKIADFGFCKQLLKQTDMAQTMVGSPIYMSPEILKGLIYDSRADIWSLGVVLYEMLYGICPYEESTIPKLVSLIDNTLIKFPPEVVVSEQLKLFIKKCLTIRYRERISPLDFIKYPLTGEIKQIQNNLVLKNVAKYIRNALLYIAETIELITPFVDDTYFLRVGYMLCKIIFSIHKNTSDGAGYWEELGLQNTIEKWQIYLENEAALLRPYFEEVQIVLTKEDTTLKTKLELETIFIDCKYYLESIKPMEDIDLQTRLINCFLYNKHFISVLEKKKPDFLDPTSMPLTLLEKTEICYKFARYY